MFKEEDDQELDQDEEELDEEALSEKANATILKALDILGRKIIAEAEMTGLSDGQASRIFLLSRAMKNLHKAFDHDWLDDDAD